MFGDTRQMLKPHFLEREDTECKLLLIYTLKVVHFPLSIVHLERSCGGILIFSDVTFIKSIYKVYFQCCSLEQGYPEVYKPITRKHWIQNSNKYNLVKQ